MVRISNVVTPQNKWTESKKQQCSFKMPYEAAITSWEMQRECGIRSNRIVSHTQWTKVCRRPVSTGPRSYKKWNSAEVLNYRAHAAHLLRTCTLVMAHARTARRLPSNTNASPCSTRFVKLPHYVGGHNSPVSARPFQGDTESGQREILRWNEDTENETKNGGRQTPAASATVVRVPTTHVRVVRAYTFSGALRFCKSGQSGITSASDVLRICIELRRCFCCTSSCSTSTRFTWMGLSGSIELRRSVELRRSNEPRRSWIGSYAEWTNTAPGLLRRHIRNSYKCKT